MLGVFQRVTRASALTLGALALLAAPASAATLAVDDNATECPSAQFTSVQAAIDAAAPGDTVAVCPGNYVEGTGAVGTNVLTINKSINLRGAGADLVWIKANPAGGGEIAAAAPVVRDGVGNLLAVTGTPAAPLDVNVSGVSFTGNGVYPEVGILFLDAGGSIVRSRVTRVVTSEAADAESQSGGYRNGNLGYGIAHVSAATSAPAIVTRTLTIEHTRVDKYNKTGILIDSSGQDAPPYTPTGVDNEATLIGNSVIGRTKCINFDVDGNCTNPGSPTTGRLFGQDGVLITAGSQATLTDNILSQNLVTGAGSPTPGNATGNNNLVLGSGLRLAGADATTLTHNNIVDNAYGVINLQLDGSTANTATPVAAEDNWWGLAQNATTNNGPAISPLTNPPVPENPVNGAATADGAGTTSTAVDFFPFRAGPQGDPNNGEFPVVDAPLPVDDHAPTVTLATDSPSYAPGSTVTVTADATDDFGVTEVYFYEGVTLLATDTSFPYTTTIDIPADAECGVTRDLTAIAYDYLSQNDDGQTSFDVDGTTEECDPPIEQEISITLDSPATSVGADGTTFVALPLADAGVAKVDFFIGAVLTCTDTNAPYECEFLPTGADVGEQSLRAVVTDNIAQTDEVTHDFEVDRFDTAGMGLRVKKGQKRKKRNTLTGAVRLPERVGVEEACNGGTITVTIVRRRKTVLTDTTRLNNRCKFSKKVGRKTLKGSFRATARFGGNTVLNADQKTRKFK